MAPLRIFSSLLLLTLAAGVVNPVLACPETILRECFIPEQMDSLWKVCSVVDGTTNCYPDMPQNMPRWGIVYDGWGGGLICPDGNSMWCYGWPPSHDPEYDMYPPNYDTYLAWGPFSLEGMAAAQCGFGMAVSAEAGHDSVFWGVATAFALTDAAMKISGRAYNTGWSWQAMDLANLRDFLTGDSISMLGRDSLYLFWRFRSDPSNVTNIGSIIDDVLLTVDDGQVDLAAGGITLLHPDSSVVSPPVFAIGDTLMVRYEWSACDGDADYAPFQVVLTVNNVLIASQTVTDMHGGDELVAYSPPWIASDWGEYTVRLAVDTLNEIPEADETNNDTTASYVVLSAPGWPNFNWITPATDTLFADSAAMLRWWFEDLSDPSFVSLYYAINPVSCMGILILGGENRPAIGADSLAWDTQALPPNHTYYVYGVITIGQIDTCIYASSPIYVLHLTGSTHDPQGAIPVTYYLAQNYPNPFNPLTGIRFGIATAGHVTLRVYNLLGQEQATLVNENLITGRYAAEFDGSPFASGLYLCVLSAPEGMLTQKMLLLK